MFRSLKFKLMALVLAVAVFSNVAMAMIARSLSTNTVSNTVKLLSDSITSDVAGVVRDEVIKQIRMLETLALTDFLQDEDISFVEKCDRTRNYTKVGSEYENIAFYDTEGNSKAATGQLIKLSNRAYLDSAFSGKNYVADPAINSVTNVMFQIYAVPVKNHAGKVIGALCSNTYADTLTKAISAINTKPGTEILVVNRKSGCVIASTVPEKVDVGAEMKSTSSGLEKAMIPVVKEMETGTHGGGIFMDPFDKKMKVAAFRPVDMSDWSVLYITPRAEFYSGLQHMIFVMTATLVAVLIFALVASYFTAVITVKPLLAVKIAIEDVATGEADLTRRIATSAKDEVGDVVRGFNAFVGKMHEIMSQLKTSKDDLGTVGSDLEASTEDTSASITQILANIESVHSQVNHQSQSVHATAGAVNEIASNIESLEKMIEKQANGVSEASAAVEQMIGNIQRVNVSVGRVTKGMLKQQWEKLYYIVYNSRRKKRILSKKRVS